MTRPAPDSRLHAARARRAALAAWANLAALANLAACAGPPPAGEVRGVGTPGVVAYLPESETRDVATMRERCGRVPAAAAPGERSLASACDQLRRTLRTQPGNAVSAGPAGY